MARRRLGKVRPARWILVGAAIAVWAAFGCAASGFAASFSQSAIEELLQRVAVGLELPVGASFRQEITLRALFATWRFASTVRKEPEGFLTETAGAPSFVPDSLPRDLINLMQSLYLFDLRVVDASDADLVVLQGPRINYSGTGPKEATFWVDVRRLVVERAEAAYSWGTLHVTQEYLDLGDRFLLLRQRARATPYGFTLDVDYVDYQIP